MYHCYICFEEIVGTKTWNTLFLPGKQKNICSTCESYLEFVPDQKCKRCSRPSKVEVCPDCKKWDLKFENNDPLAYNISLFLYNEFLREVISTWKYRGDYVMIKSFRQMFVEFFKTVFTECDDAILVPIPLSEERALERGFNQSLQLAQFLSKDVKEVFVRVHSEKQAKKSRQERIKMPNPFQVRTTVRQPVILIDDIYTTGSTLRQAAKLLKENGCPKVYSYTLIRG